MTVKVSLTRFAPIEKVGKGLPGFYRAGLPASATRVSGPGNQGCRDRGSETGVPGPDRGCRPGPGFPTRTGVAGPDRGSRPRPGFPDRTGVAGPDWGCRTGPGLPDRGFRSRGCPSKGLISFITNFVP